jgi:lipopolysaccharide transport system ATP-binding protein
MSSDLAIRVESLGKRYRIGATQGVGRYRSLREEIAEGVVRRRRKNERREFWALRDVSFDVHAGETVGIIGRNGAGKSTLLKILARITPPTTGRGETRGRVGSLLEVGTGFHPELTGLENIQLSGAIMGMRRAEVARHFDQIVEFSGLEKFLDTPVKRYSSGMYMRLAFSVAAHLDSEILLVDEVLAVGDADFQKKCLGRMEELGESGRTVLFVSHSMPSVLRLCSRVIFLDDGGVAADGGGTTVVEAYLGHGPGGAVREWGDSEKAPGDDRVRMRAVRLLDEHHSPIAEVEIRQPVWLEVEYWNLTDDPLFRPSTYIHVRNTEGVFLFASWDTNNLAWRTTPRGRGLVRVRCEFPGNFFAEGGVVVSAGVTSIKPIVYHAAEDDVVAFHVVDRSSGDGVRGEWAGDFPGVLRPMLNWECVTEEVAAPNSTA